MKKTFLSMVVVYVTIFGMRSHAAPFTQGNLAIYRTGDGIAGLSSTGSVVFLDEYTTNGILVQSILMPTNRAGANYPIEASGTASSEGQLSLSADGQYLLLTGYGTNTSYGTSSLTGSSATVVPRVVARVDYNGNIDTSTVLTNFSTANNPRAATSSDGVNIWVGGAANGVAYTTLGGTYVTQLSGLFGGTTNRPNNIRAEGIFNGQLYASTQRTNNGIYAIGLGLPTAANQTNTYLSGLPGGSIDPNGFVLLPLQTGKTDVDTLYYADDGNGGGTDAAGIFKFSLVGSNWVQNGDPIPIDLIASPNGLAASVDVVGDVTNVHLFVTTQGAGFTTTNTSLFTFTDSSGYNGTISGSPTLVAQAGARKAFRGVAFAPTSIFRIVSAAKQANDMNITWNAVGGNKYTLQATTGALDGSYATNGFVDVSPVVFVPGLANSQVTTNYMEIGGATNTPARYYRVRQSQ